MKSDEIVREARGLHADWVVFESMHHGGGQGAKSDDGEAKRKFMLWLVDDFPVMCDLIESLQAQLADYHHMSELVDGKMEENQRLRRINENLQARLSAHKSTKSHMIQKHKVGLKLFFHFMKFERSDRNINR